MTGLPLDCLLAICRYPLQPASSSRRHQHPRIGKRMIVTMLELRHDSRHRHAVVLTACMHAYCTYTHMTEHFSCSPSYLQSHHCLIQPAAGYSPDQSAAVTHPLQPIHRVRTALLQSARLAALYNPDYHFRCQLHLAPPPPPFWHMYRIGFSYCTHHHSALLTGSITSNTEHRRIPDTVCAS